MTCQLSNQPTVSHPQRTFACSSNRQLRMLWWPLQSATWRYECAEAWDGRVVCVCWRGVPVGEVVRASRLLQQVGTADAEGKPTPRWCGAFQDIRVRIGRGRGRKGPKRA
eukprot:364244-Chlamydomonas_euryale.AAC.4